MVDEMREIFLSRRRGGGVDTMSGQQEAYLIGLAEGYAADLIIYVSLKKTFSP